MVEDDAIPDWDSLAREVRLIWDNAKEYNQEGSEIYTMAEKLEVCILPTPTALVFQPRSYLTWHSLGRKTGCNPWVLPQRRTSDSLCHSLNNPKRCA
jgi:hypothetical protein